MSRKSEHAKNIAVNAAGRDWLLARAADLEELWQAMGNEDNFADERIPYWVELWPASLALASFLPTQKGLAGVSCLDLGCGLGLTAMIGAACGARMLAVDYEMEALLAARENARLNDCQNIAWLLMDWRNPALLPAALDYIWAGDIIYEKRAMRPVLDLFDLALKRKGAVWLADPGRKIFEEFIELAASSIWQTTPVFKEKIKPAAASDYSIEATVWELRRKGD